MMGVSAQEAAMFVLMMGVFVIVSVMWLHILSEGIDDD